MPFVYILRCADGTLYVGHTDDVEARLKAHNDGVGANYTAARRPVHLVYSEACGSKAAALARERQLKRWSGKKKEALASDDLKLLHGLSRRRQQ
jgi:predicted GIY-YIG superfamily endonuclease